MIPSFLISLVLALISFVVGCSAALILVFDYTDTDQEIKKYGEYCRKGFCFFVILFVLDKFILMSGLTYGSDSYGSDSFDSYESDLFGSDSTALYMLLSLPLMISALVFGGGFGASIILSLNKLIERCCCGGKKEKEKIDSNEVDGADTLTTDVEMS